MRKLFILLLVLAIFAIVHEGLHALVALALDEYAGFRVHPIGFEVLAKTPSEQRSGIGWFFFSGTSNLATIALGWALLPLASRAAGARNRFLRDLFYWLTVIFLLCDPLNLSIGPFIYGGDVNGIAVGLGLPRLLVQAVFLVVFLINRELAARRLLPAYGVTTDNFLFRPWSWGSAPFSPA